MKPSSLHGAHIVITRPAGQATKLSQLVSEAGGEFHLFPLIAIAPLEDYSAFNQCLMHLPEVDWAIFISSNAVEHGMPRVVNAWASLPVKTQFAAIGPVTAQALKAFGVKHTLTPEHRFDSEALLALAEMHAMEGKRVMIFRGVGGREVLADTLSSRGAEVSFAECYRRVNPQTSIAPLKTLAEAHPRLAIVVTSSEAMRYLLDMALMETTALPPHHWLHRAVLCVNHARIAELPTQMGLNVAIAEAPGDEAMLSCLNKALAKLD